MIEGNRDLPGRALVGGRDPLIARAAARCNAVETAGQTMRDLRIAEVLRQDVPIEGGKVKNYCVRLGISFKHDSGD